MIEQKIGYTKQMAEYDRKLEIAKKVALVLSENRALVDDLREIFSLAQRQLSVSILPDSEQSQRFADNFDTHYGTPPIFAIIPCTIRTA